MIKFDDLPKEIQFAMVFNQVLQGNPPDEEIFRKKTDADKSEGGFTWLRSFFGGHSFWEDIIINGKYDLFFNQYKQK